MHKMFISAAWFNWLVGVALLVSVDGVFSVFHIRPVPDQLLFVHFFSVLVIAFGFAYYWISRDIAVNRPLIHIGAVGKLMLVGIGVVDVMLGIVSWQILFLLSVDLVYAVLFILALRAERIE